MAEAKRRRREYWAGLGAVLIAVAVGWSGVWPVPQNIATERALDSILNDRVLIGIVRLTLVLIAFYAIASIPALIIGGRWVKGLGTSGILADDARAASQTLAVAAEQEVDDLQRRNDALEALAGELWALVDAETAPD